ncbi:MAG: hypothetical protein WCP09_03335 [Candidatus Taylorbacteria bacterium]
MIMPRGANRDVLTGNGQQILRDQSAWKHVGCNGKILTSMQGRALNKAARWSEGRTARP